MSKLKSLFVAATAAEAKAAAGSVGAHSDLRAWLTGQALAGMQMRLPPGSHDALDIGRSEALRLRAEWAVEQADAVLVALGLGGDAS